MKRKISAGARKTNITPPVGIAMAGSFTEIKALGIQDELYANSIVINDGDKEIAIVSVDVCAISDSIFKDIICRIENSCGIISENIIIAATHTHTGPKLDDIFLGVGETWDEYVENFKKCVVSSVIMAQKRKQPVRIGAGRGKNGKYVFNRRLKKPGGTIIMNFTDKKHLQDSIEEGPTDAETIFLVFEDDSGKPFAFIVNHANHNNAMGGCPFISPDWSGHISKILSKVYGEDVVTLFLAGACGDVNWINYKDFNQVCGPELVERIGTSLAGTILENIADTDYPEIDRIDVLHKRLLIPDRPFCDYDTKEDNTFGVDEGVKQIFAQYVKEKEFAKDKKPVVNEVDICVVSIGENIAIASNPTELFAEYGLKIKENSPYDYTMISELTNGYAGYVCTKHAFGEGGYEVRKTNRSSHLEIEAGEKIVEASIDALKSICG